MSPWFEKTHEALQAQADMGAGHGNRSWRYKSAAGAIRE